MELSNLLSHELTMVATITDKIPASTISRGTKTSMDWGAIRRAYIESTERPTHQELATQFSCPENRIARVASEEGWAMLRAQRLEAALKEGNASEIILKAAKVDQTHVRNLSGVAIAALAELARILTDLSKDERAPSTRAQVVQSVSFSMLNVANALKTAGCVGIPKALADGARNGNGAWDAGMLQQINVTVQNLAKSEPAKEKLADADV